MLVIGSLLIHKHCIALIYLGLFFSEIIHSFQCRHFVWFIWCHYKWKILSVISQLFVQGQAKKKKFKAKKFRCRLCLQYPLTNELKSYLISHLSIKVGRVPTICKTLVTPRIQSWSHTNPLGDFLETLYQCLSEPSTSSSEFLTQWFPIMVTH